MAVADRLEVLRTKYVNMMWLLKHLDLLGPKENIALLYNLHLFSRKACSTQSIGSTKSF